MQTKLTLRLDARLIQRAKVHARRRGKSVSQMVAEYFSLLEQQKQPEDTAPLTRSLRGALRDTGGDEGAYRKYLEEQ